MTDNKVVKMVNENMDGDSETHNENNGDVGITTPVVPTPTDHTVTSKKEETPLLENIPEEDDKIPDLIVDDSKGSEGSIHELSQSQHGVLDKDEVKSQNKDKTTSVVDDPQLDKLEEVEDKKPWKLEDEMTEADKEYFDKIQSTEVSAEQHFKAAVLKVMSQMDTFLKSVAFDYLEKVKISFGELMEIVKQLPSSKYLNQVDKELDINSPLS